VTEYQLAQARSVACAIHGGSIPLPIDLTGGVTLTEAKEEG
jgi:hypothetical protein